MSIREREKRIYRKRIPYGMQNFSDVIMEDCYYVDKTPFIEAIEEAHKYFFFIRPRRFGKSLTLSMLENYYDINKKDQFESLFGNLYIGNILPLSATATWLFTLTFRAFPQDWMITRKDWTLIAISCLNGAAIGMHTSCLQTPRKR